MWRNVNQVFLVNGHIEKADANFVGGLSFEEVEGINIYIGPYPQLQEDAVAMKAAGVTGVLNVQTDIDIEHRGYNWPRMQGYYKEQNIQARHFPIHDFNE